MSMQTFKWQSGHTYWLILMAVCVLLQWLDFAEIMRFDRAAIEQGHLGLLLSGNLVHLNWSHLWLNTAGLLMVAIFFSHYLSCYSWIILTIWSGMLVGFCLYIFNPEIFWYVGMSGVLHGLFIVGAWQEFRHHKVSGLSILSLLIIKLIWEQSAGALPSSEAMAGGRVVVDSHLYGAIAGVLFVVLTEIKRARCMRGQSTFKPL